MSDARSLQATQLPVRFDAFHDSADVVDCLFHEGLAGDGPDLAHFTSVMDILVFRIVDKIRLLAFVQIAVIVALIAGGVIGWKGDDQAESSQSPQ
jgi:hypothetical protein